MLVGAGPIHRPWLSQYKGVFKMQVLLQTEGMGFAGPSTLRCWNYIIF